MGTGQEIAGDQEVESRGEGKLMKARDRLKANAEIVERTVATLKRAGRHVQREPQRKVTDAGARKAIK